MTQKVETQQFQVPRQRHHSLAYGTFTGYNVQCTMATESNSEYQKSNLTTKVLRAGLLTKEGEESPVPRPHTSEFAFAFYQSIM
jgi:hypothetical protein